MGTSLRSDSAFAIDAVSWTRRREEGGREILEKRAGLTAEAASGRRRLRNHYLVTFGLDCSGIAHPLGLSNDDTSLVLTLPWIEGLDLDAYVKVRCAALGSKVLPTREALTLTYKAARIVADLADRGVVHRAVAPGHFVVDPVDHNLWLLNFGRSRFMRGASMSEPGPPADHCEDLRALGRLLYWLATGEAYEAVEGGASPADAAAGLPEMIGDVAVRLLNAGAKQGYWHAAAAAADLLSWRDAKDVGALGTCGTPPDLVMSGRRVGRTPGVVALLSAYSEIARAPAENTQSNRAERRRSILALVSGRAGVGKTTLVLDACRAMRQWGARVDFGKFNQYGDSRPMFALLQALNGVVGQILEGDEESRVAAAARIQMGLGELAQVVVDVVPRLAGLLGPQPTVPALSGEASRAQFELLLRRFVGALATPETPLTLFLDDLQWADARSLDLVRGLLRTPRSIIS